MKFTAVVLALLCFSSSASAQAPARPSLRAALEQIDSLAAAEYERDKLGSLTIGVVSGGQLVWSKSYGFADAEKRGPATIESVYRVGSITMQFTALMLLQLEQEGKVHLSDPVEKYYPEIKKIPVRFPLAPPITLLQLATHTSGLASEPDDAAFAKGPVADWEKILLAALPHSKYAYEPGTRVAYSNLGYAILGAALSRAANQPFVAYVQQRIFAPLGMTGAAFEPNAQMAPRLAKGYVFEGGKVDTGQPEAEHQGRGYKVPGGALYATVGDMAKFVAFELGAGPEGVLKKEVWEENFRRLAVLADERQSYVASGYGIGYRFRVRGDRLIWGFAGGTAGYEARADFDTAAHTGVVVLRNVGGRTIHVSTTKLVGDALDILSAATRDTAKGGKTGP
jgi:CubicO group peptidase (beta-lactamase class C family)